MIKKSSSWLAGDYFRTLNLGKHRSSVHKKGKKFFLSAPILYARNVIKQSKTDVNTCAEYLGGSPCIRQTGLNHEKALTEAFLLTLNLIPRGTVQFSLYRWSFTS